MPSNALCRDGCARIKLHYCDFGEVVPGGGIEPPTQGFSIPCSTPELPGRVSLKRG